MQATPTPSDILIQFVPITIICLVFGFVVRALAKDKGRNVALWTTLGFIPFVNLILYAYFVGASNLRIEKKIDALLSNLNQDPNSFR